MLKDLSHVVHPRPKNGPTATIPLRSPIGGACQPELGRPNQGPKTGRTTEGCQSKAYTPNQVGQQTTCHLGTGARRLLPLVEQDHALLDKACVEQEGQDSLSHARLSVWCRMI
jgi:hypothetical protein